jgi:hypothetical protein
MFNQTVLLWHRYGFYQTVALLMDHTTTMSVPLHETSALSANSGLFKAAVAVWQGYRMT